MNVTTNNVATGTDGGDGGSSSGADRSLTSVAPGLFSAVLGALRF